MRRLVRILASRLLGTPTQRRRPGVRVSLEHLETRLVPANGPSAYQVSYSGALDPTIAFSAGQDTVAIQNAISNLAIPRPVVSTWNYQPPGAIFWVSTSGSDQNTGGATHPFATIARAVAAAGPGDAVYIRAGTYREALTITKSGNAANPIIISCAPGDLGKVKITPSASYVQNNPSGAVITLSAVNHVWLNGLVVQGPKGRFEAPLNEDYGANGITLRSGGGLGVRITNNVVYNNMHTGIKEMGHGTTGFVIEGNIIFGNGRDALDHGIYMPANGVTMNGNVIFDNSAWGIHSYSTPANQTVTSNLIFGNAGGIIFGGAHNKLANNTVAYNGFGVMYFRGGCIGNEVDHNIVAFNNTDSFYDNGGGKLGNPTGNSDDYNNYFSGGVSAYLRQLNTVGSHELCSDPGFINAASGDFTLTALSPSTTLGAFGEAVEAALPNGAISGPTNGVRGQSLTFTFSASDPSTPQGAAYYEYSVDWGDGNTQTITAASSIGLNHIYSNSGSYTVRASAMDSEGRSIFIGTATLTISDVQLPLTLEEFQDMNLLTKPKPMLGY